MLIGTTLKDLINDKEVKKIEIVTTNDDIYSVCYINNNYDKPLFVDKEKLIVIEKIKKGGVKNA